MFFSSFIVFFYYAESIFFEQKQKIVRSYITPLIGFLMGENNFKILSL